MQFYTEDKQNETGVITTHGLQGLMLARRVRLLFNTKIRYAGHLSKCFRFEILGCPECK